MYELSVSELDIFEICLVTGCVVIGEVKNAAIDLITFKFIWKITDLLALLMITTICVAPINL